MVRIPSALKWLLTRRARLQGELSKLDRRQPALVLKLEREIEDSKNRLEACVRRLETINVCSERRRAAIRYDIATLENAIRQYNPDVDISKASVIQTQEALRATRHGEMSRLILQALREAAPAPLSTTEIAAYVANWSDSEVAETDFPDFRIRVRHRMRGMVVAGTLRRALSSRTSLEGYWMLGESSDVGGSSLAPNSISLPVAAPNN